MPTFEDVSVPQPSTAGSDSHQDSQPAQFPPVTRDHILNCSYDAWFPRYRASCLKSRIIQLPPEFVEYLREDGITLAEEDPGRQGGADDDEEDWVPSIATGVFENPAVGERSGSDSDSDSDDDVGRPAPQPPNLRFPELHQRIKDEIRRLGGEVVPKLNWSSPRDATWIMMDKNTMRCTSPNDVYLLLKSSSFISHDLEHAFVGCIAPRLQPQEHHHPHGQARGVSDQTCIGTLGPPELGFNPVLVLRPYFKPQTALEFRCFVKHRNLVAISQRDLKHYPFLAGLREAIVSRTKQLFEAVLRFTFPDGSFVFDVYIPEGDSDESSGTGSLSRARLMDINPWAPRTDSLLFDWEELLDLRVPHPVLGTRGDDEDCDFGAGSQSDADETTDESDAENDFEPELRLVSEDDPIASSSLASPYSAHKLPKEVVDASAAGEGGLRMFAEEWRRMVEKTTENRQ